jgi:hypothetical protein
MFGMFHRQRMLVIDGKYNSDDGLSTTTMISSSDIQERQATRLIEDRSLDLIDKMFVKLEKHF